MLFLLAGAERYKAITTNHMRNADGVILVYDINSPSSFDKVNYWLNSVREVSKENTTIYLFGNKIDLLKSNNSITINSVSTSNRNMRRVSLEKVIKYVEEKKIDHWIECSAKTGEMISDTFKRFYLEVYNKQKSSMESKVKQFTTIYQTSVGNYPRSKTECC